MRLRIFGRILWLRNSHRTTNFRYSCKYTRCAKFIISNRTNENDRQAIQFEMASRSIFSSVLAVSIPFTVYWLCVCVSQWDIYLINPPIFKLVFGGSFFSFPLSSLTFVLLRFLVGNSKTRANNYDEEKIKCHFEVWIFSPTLR